MNALKWTSLLFGVLVCLSSLLCNDLSPQEELLEKFFGSSRRLGEVIPKKNLSDGNPIKVNFSFIVNHVFDIKSDEEKLDLGFWIAMRWKSELVSWNVTEYPVERLEVPSEKVWMPMLFLKQKAVSSFLKPDSGTFAVIYPDGYTQIDFGVRVQLSCSMPACLFPMDKHTCPLEFFPVNKFTKVLLLVPDHETRKGYDAFVQKSTGLWKIEMHDMVPKQAEMIARGKTEIYTVMTSHLTFKHKPEYYWLTVLSPITLICVITFFAILLPRDTGERSSLLITCLLAQIVYLDTVLKNVPKTSDYIPLLVVFLLIVLLFTAFQIGLTAITSYYAERANKRKILSPLHQKFTKLLCKLCMIRKKKDNQVKVFKQESFYESEIELKKKPSLHSCIDRNTDDTLNPTTDLTPVEENFAIEEKQEQSEAKPKSKGCKMMCKAMDRFSTLASLVMLVGMPIMFQFMYDGTVAYDCSTKKN